MKVAVADFAAEKNSPTLLHRVRGGSLLLTSGALKKTSASVEFHKV